MKKRYVSIVGPIISGTSFSFWGTKYCGSETIMKQIGAEGDIEVYVNSPGGSVFAGYEIVNAFNAAVRAGRSVTFYVSAMAASIASYITCGVKGATVCMAENGKLMFHAPWTVVVGSKGNLQDAHDLLEKMEIDIRSAVSARGVKVEDSWFATDRNKFFSAGESVEMKLADRIEDPPMELINYVVEVASAQDKGDFWDKADVEARKEQTAGAFDHERFAANIEFEGYLTHVCSEHYGEQVTVSDVTKETFSVTRQDGSSVLLKYTPDSLTIVAIDWDAVDSKKENDMSVKKDKPGVEPTAAAQTPEPTAPTTDAPDTAVAAQEPAPVEPVEEPAPTEPAAVADAPDATNTVEPAATAAADDHGLTPDMIAFAKENYQRVRTEYVDTIKASEQNEFTDDELNGFSNSILSKIAKLAKSVTVQKDVELMADNSIVPSPKGSKGTGGSLPPPEL